MIPFGRKMSNRAARRRPCLTRITVIVSHMLVDVTDRGTGKTTRALAWLAASPSTRVLVTMNNRHAQAIAVDKYGPEALKWFIIYPNHYMYMQGTSVTEVWIDDAECFLLMSDVLAGMPPGASVAGISVTGEVMQ